MRVPPLFFFCFFPGVFLSSRMTGACPVTTGLIMRVNVRITTTTACRSTAPVSRVCRTRALDHLSYALNIFLSRPRVARLYHTEYYRRRDTCIQATLYTVGENVSSTDELYRRASITPIKSFMQRYLEQVMVYTFLFYCGCTP